MDLEAHPTLDPRELVAVRLALARAGVERDGVPLGYASAWRVTALAESTGGEDDVLDGDYTRSPRSTLGASRA